MEPWTWQRGTGCALESAASTEQVVTSGMQHTASWPSSLERDLDPRSQAQWAGGVKVTPEKGENKEEEKSNQDRGLFSWLTPSAQVWWNSRDVGEKEEVLLTL